MVFDDYFKYAQHCAQNGTIYNKNVTIFTDSNFVFSLLKITGFPKHNYYYKLMERIINLANLLNDYNVNIEIIKIRGHKNIDGNEQVDKLARRTAKRVAHLKKIRDKFYQPKYNSIMVDISLDFKKLKYKFKDNRNMEWENFINNIRIENDKNNNSNNEINERENTSKVRFPNCTHLLMHHIYINKNNIKPINNAMKSELKHLNPLECEIINKLRTEYINLNNFKYKFFNETNGNCSYCSGPIMPVRDDITHFLMDCKINNEMSVKMNKLRHDLRRDLRKMHVHFRNDYNWNPDSMLFPHYWAPMPAHNDPKYYYKYQGNIRLRVNIIKRVVRFVIATKRFEKEKYGY